MPYRLKEGMIDETTRPKYEKKQAQEGRLKTAHLRHGMFNQGATRTQRWRLGLCLGRGGKTLARSFFLFPSSLSIAHAFDDLLYVIYGARRKIEHTYAHAFDMETYPLILCTTLPLFIAFSFGLRQRRGEERRGEENGDGPASHRGRRDIHTHPHRCRFLFFFFFLKFFFL